MWISFHVYDVAENRFHPLTTTIDDFERAGYGDRVVRITEWGLGEVDGNGQVAGIRAAMSRVLLAGHSGVLFWWDDVHRYGSERFRQACE